MNEEEIIRELEYFKANGEPISVSSKMLMELYDLYNQEKEKNKKLRYGIDNIRNNLELGDYYNCQDAADDLTRLLGEEVEE